MQIDVFYVDISVWKWYTDQHILSIKVVEPEENRSNRGWGVGRYMKREQIRRWLGFPLEESCRASIEQALVQSTHRTTMTIGILILAFQALMFLLTTFRSGGPFYSQRRTLYWVLYILLFTVTLVLLLMARRLHKGKPVSYTHLTLPTTSFV